MLHTRKFRPTASTIELVNPSQPQPSASLLNAMAAAAAGMMPGNLFFF